MLSPLFPKIFQKHSDDQHGRTAISPKPHPDRDLRHAAVPTWRVQPPGNSNSRRTRQRFDSFRVEPVGSTRTTRVDVRVVTATNRDLRQLVHEREFREDLYFGQFAGLNCQRLAGF